MEGINCQLLWKLIDEKDFNISELSRSAGISRSTIYNITSGKNLPSSDVMVKLATTLEFTESNFFDVFWPNFKNRD